MDVQFNYDDYRNIIISSDIDELTVIPIIDSILRINYKDDYMEQNITNYVRKPITLRIHTYGGDVYASLSLYEIIQLSKTPIITYSMGAIMSAGFIIFLAGHIRISSQFSTFMFHEVITGGFDKLEFLSNSLEEGKRLQTIYEKIIMSSTNLSKTEIKELKSSGKDYFISAKEALRLGITNEIVTIQHKKRK